MNISYKINWIWPSSKKDQSIQTDDYTFWSYVVALSGVIEYSNINVSLLRQLYFRYLLFVLLALVPHLMNVYRVQL